MSPGNLPPPSSAVVHPLVLLSVVDHYNRVAIDTKKRVIGVLLGETSKKGVVQITNSFALPFEEDEKDQKVWYVDHQYLEKMFVMFRKVNASENIVGYYSTGPRLKESDADLNELMAGYADWPLLLICEVQPKDEGLPVTAYYMKEVVREDGTQRAQKTFINISTEVGATEAEEVGVEHLLRDAKDNTIGTLSTNVDRMVGGLSTLKSRLLEVKQYLELVVAGKLPVNHDIIYNLQDAFNLLPNIGPDLQQSFAAKSNDLQLVIYVGSLIRAVLALHNLISNKEQRLWKENSGKAKTETSPAESAQQNGSKLANGQSSDKASKK